MSRASRSWIATVAATVVSTYALDATAAAAGFLLVASNLLADLEDPALLAVLAASYAAWAAALQPALAANWALLERTGASACLPSKAAHSFVLSKGLPPGACRMAASLGYVGTELAKEAPYYVGVASAALLTEAVSSREAVVFLAGANLGAALYELGLARLVRLVLARVPASNYASFEDDWKPASYLRDYYHTIEPDERRTIAFLVESARELPSSQRMLVFGVGPTLHHVFPFAPKAHSIDLCDFLPANLVEIGRWLADGPGAHDWRTFVRHALVCEGGPVTDDAVARREALTRACVGQLLQSDLRDARPLGDSVSAYDLVVSAFCADSATDDLATWALYTRRIAALVRPGGTLIIAALWQSRGYRVGDRLFPSANLAEQDLRRVLGPLTTSLEVETCPMPEQARHGYCGILLARGQTQASQASHPPPPPPVTAGQADAA